MKAADTTVMTDQEPPPPRTHQPNGHVWVVGTRGGVGTSTIARALGGHDAGLELDPPPGATVVVVTGPSVADTALLPAVVDRCSLPGHRRPVVAVVSDGHGRWPAATRARLRMLRDRVDVVAVPWVSRWRWRGADDQTTAGWLAAVTHLARTTGVERPGIDVVASRPWWRGGKR